MSNRPRTSSRALTTLTVLLIIFGLAAVTTGALFWGGGDVAEGPSGNDLATVEQGSFDIVIPASGELSALKQTEIASRLEGRAVITSIVNEGEYVNEGEELIRFDDEEVNNRERAARLSVDNAEARLAASQATLDIRRDSSESELSLAQVDIELAELELKAWEEGDAVSRRQTLSLDVETTEKDYKRLAARFEASADLLKQEFISQDEYDRDEIAMIRARSAWTQAELALDVYDEYTTRQERARLEANVKKATDKLAELQQRVESELENLTRDVANKQFSLESEQTELAKSLAQLENCSIIAPQSGLVVYASSLRTGRWGRNDDTPPTIGTEVRRNQTVIVLPDVTEMAAEVKVNEARSGKIKPGQPVVVYSDAVPDQPIQGVVDSVGVLAESGGWRDPNRRDYTVRIRLEGIEDLSLKPAMRAKALISVDRVEDVKYVPVPSVFRDGRRAFVYVPDGSGFAAREIQTGRASELFIEVRNGLEAGERVLMREPRADQITQRLPELEEGDAPRGRGGPPPGVTGGKPAGATGGRPTTGGKPAGVSSGRPAGT